MKVKLGRGGTKGLPPPRGKGLTSLQHCSSSCRSRTCFLLVFLRWQWDPLAREQGAELPWPWELLQLGPVSWDTRWEVLPNATLQLAGAPQGCWTSSRIPVCLVSRAEQIPPDLSCFLNWGREQKQQRKKVHI